MKPRQGPEARRAEDGNREETRRGCESMKTRRGCEYM